MKSTLLLILSLGLASCATKATEPGQTPPNSKAGSNKVAKKESVKPKPYPLKTCLVTGDGLDEMDERVSLVHEGQIFEFCCKPCVKKFRKNPDKYVKELAKAKG